MCVWYHCRSVRRQRKCSRANGVHNLQRILPGEQKRKIKDNQFKLAFPFRNTTSVSVCRARQKSKLKCQSWAGCPNISGSALPDMVVLSILTLDGGEYSSEYFKEVISGQGVWIWVADFFLNTPILHFIFSTSGYLHKK